MLDAQDRGNYGRHRQDQQQCARELISGFAQDTPAASGACPTPLSELHKRPLVSTSATILRATTISL
jgi:hypothetical protein